MTRRLELSYGIHGWTPYSKAGVHDKIFPAAMAHDMGLDCSGKGVQTEASPSGDGMQTGLISLGRSA